jgi:hypothetical protein
LLCSAFILPHRYLTTSVAAQCFVLAVFVPQRKSNYYYYYYYIPFPLQMGVSHSIFVRFSQFFLPSSSGRALLRRCCLCRRRRRCHLKKQQQKQQQQH